MLLIRHLFLLIGCLPLMLFAEGTKQLMPAPGDSVGRGVIVISHNGDPGNYGFFGLTQASPDNRICFSIASTTEKVYFGMQWQYVKLGKFRITNTSGVVVYDTTTVPTSGPGYIASYGQAIAGPSVTATGGYNPLVFFPPSAGVYYLEFMDTIVIGSNPTDPVLHYFDLTVTNASNTPIAGRLWSKNWYFSTMSDYAMFYGKLFIYSDDQVVTQIDFNGMLPHLFRIGCNHNGCNNYQPFIEARKSRIENSVYPEYKVFFNNPDSVLFPTGAPGAVNSVNVSNPCDGTVDITVDVTKTGSVSVMIGINPLPGFQDEDVNLVEDVTAGSNIITWDGLDGLGNPVANGTPVTFDITYINGLTNMPLYDIEIQPTGFIVDLIRPTGPKPALYWDDTDINGTINLDGCLNTNGCHTWGITIGDTKTLNTWWYAFTDVWPTLSLAYRRNQSYSDAVHICPSDSVLFAGNYIHTGGEYSHTFTATLGCDSTINLAVTVMPGPVANFGPDTTLCQGSSLTLQVTTGTGFTYLWNTGATTPSITVNSTGTYSVVATAPNGCTAGDEINVTAASPILPKLIRHN